MLIWGTLRIFRGLDTAFSDIYESGAANSFADQLLDGVVVLFAVAFDVVVGATVETSLGGLGSVPGGWVIQRGILAVGLFVVLFPMYYIFPDEEDMILLEAVPGTAFAAVGLALFQTLFRFYIEISSRSPQESLLAGILVFLTWLYFSGLVILLGAVVNAVLTNRSVDVSIRPVVGGIAPSMTNSKYSDEDISGRLHSLEQRLAHAEEITFEVDGERYTLPEPSSAHANTAESALLFDSGQTELHLSWRSVHHESQND